MDGSSAVSISASNINLWMMIGMFILLVATTWMGPGRATRGFLLVVGAAFLTWLAYMSASYLAAVGMAFVLGLLFFYWFCVAASVNLAQE